MANYNMTTTSQLGSAVEVYYDRVLLRHAEPKLVHALFGLQKKLPSKSSATVKFRRTNALAVATTPLTEGMTPNAVQLTKTDILATVNQYGSYTIVTDIVDMTTENQPFTIAAKELGSQMGRTIDQITRDIVVACASQTTCSNGSGTATFLNRTDIDTVVQTLLAADADRMAPIVKASTGIGTSPVRESFWGILDADLMLDIEAVSGFKSVAEYPNQGSVLKAEWGETGQVRWTMTSVGYVSGGTYSCPIFGADAYGIVKLSGGNAENIRKPFGSGDDPLNQRATSGWKAMYAAKVLNEDFMHVLICTT